ncbi:hypothetical protein ZIOFF_062233 [Zingiber officinale]|uniref:Uncharacterized protein n=1 Tax=Zingiber officinale TaxID=94328 RepID=A0A8J5K8T1_ZINOF|nr:hypothetical protein ZIOFF_065198 [Zingiber officinale]KAG6478789.1 hypothetical protein ZIOFF_062233 [Zingiber officinale]
MGKGVLRSAARALSWPRGSKTTCSAEVPEDVKEGEFAVVAVWNEEATRFVASLSCLSNPVFLRLLELAEEEFGCFNLKAIEMAAIRDGHTTKDRLGWSKKLMSTLLSTVNFSTRKLTLICERTKVTIRRVDNPSCQTNLEVSQDIIHSIEMRIVKDLQKISGHTE